MEQKDKSRLAHITNIINTKSDLHEVLMQVTKAISEEIVRGSTVGIFLPKEDGTFRGFAGKPDKIVDLTIGSLVIDPEKDMLAKEVIATNKTIYIPDTAKDDRPNRKLVEVFNIKSMLAVPITLDHELFGLIFLFDHGSPMKLTGLDIKSVEAYVKMAAVAIKNSNNLKRREHLLAQNQLFLSLTSDLTRCSAKEDSLSICFSYLEKILGSKIVTAACLLEPKDNDCNYVVYGDNGEEADWIRMEQTFKSIVQEVIRTKKPIYIPDTLKDERTNHEGCRHLGVKDLLVFPLVSLGEVLGAITAANKDWSSLGYQECIIQLAQSIVDATATVFSNLQYVDRLENMVDERTKELAQANDKVISVIEGITGGFLALDKNWKFTYVNQHKCLPNNKTAQDVLGKNIWEIFPETVDTVMYKELHRAMSEQTPGQFELFSLYGDNWFEVDVYPYDEGICCFFKDITEKKKYEEEFKRLSSLDLIGQMAAGISHEIRNPMTTVRGFLQLLLMEQDYGKHHEYFEIMIEELDRANSIITEFLSMGNTKTHDIQMRNLNTIILDMIPLIEIDAVTQNKMIEVKTENVPELLLNHNEIRQLIMNLYRNGLEAMEEGKTLSIRTFQQDGYVVLAVSDEGDGITTEVMEKLGTPFFTTKDNGTGLGLGVCFAIAARHNANIEIESGSEGTTFLVKFKIGQRFD